MLLSPEQFAEAREILIDTAFSKDKWLRLANQPKVVQAFLLDRGTDHFKLSKVQYPDLGKQLDTAFLQKMLEGTQALRMIREVDVGTSDVTTNMLTLFPNLERLRINVWRSSGNAKTTAPVFSLLAAAIVELPRLEHVEIRFSKYYDPDALRKFFDTLALQKNITSVTWLGVIHNESVANTLPILPYVRRFETDCQFVARVNSKLPALQEYIGHHDSHPASHEDEVRDRERVSTELMQLLVSRAKTLESFKVTAFHTYTAEKWPDPNAAVPSGVAMERLHTFKLFGAELSLAQFAAQNLLGARNLQLTTFAWMLSHSQRSYFQQTAVLKALDADTHVSNLSLDWRETAQKAWHLAHSTTLHMPLVELETSPWVLSKHDFEVKGFQVLKHFTLSERGFPGGVALLTTFLGLISKHTALESFRYDSRAPDYVPLYFRTVTQAIEKLPQHVRSFTWNLESMESMSWEDDEAVALQAELLDALRRNAGLVVFECNLFPYRSRTDSVTLTQAFSNLLQFNHRLAVLDMVLMLDLGPFVDALAANGTLEYVRGAYPEHLYTPLEIKNLCVKHRLERQAILAKQAMSVAISRAYLSTHGNAFRESFPTVVKSIAELADLPYTEEDKTKAEKYANAYYRFGLRHPDAVQMPPAAQSVLQQAQLTERVVAYERKRKRPKRKRRS